MEAVLKFTLLGKQHTAPKSYDGAIIIGAVIFMVAVLAVMYGATVSSDVAAADMVEVPFYP